MQEDGILHNQRQRQSRRGKVSQSYILERRSPPPSVLILQSLLTQKTPPSYSPSKNFPGDIHPSRHTSRTRDRILLLPGLQRAEEHDAHRSAPSRTPPTADRDE